MRDLPNSAATKGVSEHPLPGNQPTIDLIREAFSQSAVHVNLGQQMIIVTEDRLRLDLGKLTDSTRHRNEWHVPAGMLITEIAVFATSSFHDSIGLSAQEWEGVFMTLIVLTVFWLALAVRRRGLGDSSVDSLLENLKTGGRSVAQDPRIE